SGYSIPEIPPYVQFAAFALCSSGLFFAKMVLHSNEKSSNIITELYTAPRFFRNNNSKKGRALLTEGN
ncbi:MAG: hypothetical protein J6W93_00190, partial [Clostridia bacterium]|nr:hypothetical protein [Clostridia bacterium]